MSHENILRLWNDAVTGGRVRPLVRIINKTANYTVTPDNFGSVFTTRGATSQVTFTLPAASAENKGHWNLFINVADQAMFVAGADGGLVIFNNLTADNIGFSTSGELIGGMFVAISDGTSWIVLPIGTETQTVGEVSGTATSTASYSGTSTTTPSASGTSTTTPSSSGTSTTTRSSSATWSISGSDTASHTQSASSTTSATSTRTSSTSKSSTPTSSISKTSTRTSSASSTATATGTP